MLLHDGRISLRAPAACNDGEVGGVGRDVQGLHLKALGLDYDIGRIASSCLV